VLSNEITDGVILLRPFRFGDTEDLFAAVRESLTELKPWMSWAHDGYSLQEAKDFIRITRARWQDGTLFAFAITDVKNESILGGCSLSHIHPVYHLCNLGYWVRTSRRGEGIAVRATKLAARYAFENVGLIRVEIVMSVKNNASRRVAEKAGAHYEGILHNRMVVGREIFDAHMYSLIPKDFGLMTSL
jgi:RimJ/RimL family protein N-acetyltransferase